jgi:hypothetical protein
MSRDIRKSRRTTGSVGYKYRTVGAQDQVSDRLFRRLTSKDAGEYGSDKEFASSIKNEFRDNYQLRDININMFAIAVIFLSYYQVRTLGALKQKFSDDNIKPMLFNLLPESKTGSVEANLNKYKEDLLRYISFILISRGVQGIPY